MSAVLLFIFIHLSVCLEAQKIAEKTNLAGWATLSPNIGSELALSSRWSMDANLSYHPWKISETASLRHWILSAEIRRWFCRVWEGSFIGLHALGGQFNIRDLPLPGMSREYAYAGFLGGGGLSYGYHLPLSPRWGIELAAGAGYLLVSYDKYECRECREKIARGYYSYFGLTRLGVSLVYFLQ